MNDSFYKLSFVCAVALHIALLLFLLVKFNTTRSVALNQSNNIINAVMVSQNTLSSPITKPIIKPEIKPVTKSNPVIPRDNLLAEMAELKKERQEYKKSIDKERQKQMQKIMQEQVLAEQKQLSDVPSKAYSSSNTQSQGEVDKYMAMIKQAITSSWIVPDGLGESDFCRVKIRIVGDGTVIDIKLLDSSGNASMNRSVLAAISKASPLPMPQDLALLNEFREINLKFTTKDKNGETK